MFNRMLVTFAFVMIALVIATSSFAQLDLSGYRTMLVTDSKDDYYNLSAAIRESAARIGFTVVSSADVLDPNEQLTTCAVSYSVSFRKHPFLETPAATVFVRLHDMLSRQVILQVTGKAQARFSEEANAKNAVTEAIHNIKYKGYNEQAHLSNIKLLFKDRPIISIDEGQFRKSPFSSDIEGIWGDTDNKYSIAIMQDATKKYGDYVGVILSSNNPIWKKGEIKIEIKSTAVDTVFIGDYYLSNKAKAGTTFTMDDPSLLKLTSTLPDGKQQSFMMIKTFPKIERTIKGKATDVVYSGTGFLISVDGLIATNYHVIKDANDISVVFPELDKTYAATVVLKDSSNDLALLRLKDYSSQSTGLTHLPYALRKSQTVSMGDKVSTIGYPLEFLMGHNPKYTEGVISSKTGLQDDSRCFQISASIQAGNSGSPLLDGKGCVIGVVVATLNANYLYSISKALPQNVNFAIKADYLITLLEMLPDPLVSNIQVTSDPQTISKYVVLIRAK